MGLPAFPIKMIITQIRDHPYQPCTCVSQHGGSGRYVFLGPDSGNYRRNNYARRVFRPACDGRYEAAPGRPARVVIADQTTSRPGVPIAVWPAAASPGAHPDAEYLPRRGHGIAAVSAERPLESDAVRAVRETTVREAYRSCAQAYGRRFWDACAVTTPHPLELALILPGQPWSVSRSGRPAMPTVTGGRTNMRRSVSETKRSPQAKDH